MPDVLSFNPARALDANANGSPGAKALFYDSGTSTLRTVYSDAACTVPHASPLVADATGTFAAVFSNAAAIKVVVTDSAGATLYTIDPCVRVSATGAAASAISFVPTVALPFDNVQAAIEGSVAAAASGFNAFGLGVTGSVALLANLDATNIAAGQYRFDGTTSGTYPSGVLAANTGAIVVVRETSSSAWMTLFHDTTNRQWARRMNASVWGAWREVPSGAGVITSTDTIAANNNDTTIPTSAAVKAYTDTAVVGAVGLDYLGAVATASGTTQTLSSLNLTLYRFVRLVLNGVGVTFSSNTLNVAGAAITTATVSNSARIRGIVDIELATGTGASNVADITAAAPSGAASIVFGLRTSLSTASTSISVSCSTGAFNAGNVLIYGAK